MARAGVAAGAAAARRRGGGGRRRRRHLWRCARRRGNLQPGRAEPEASVFADVCTPPAWAGLHGRTGDVRQTGQPQEDVSNRHKKIFYGAGCASSWRVSRRSWLQPSNRRRRHRSAARRASETRRCGGSSSRPGALDISTITGTSKSQRRSGGGSSRLGAKFLWSFRPSSGHRHACSLGPCDVATLVPKPLLFAVDFRT